MNQFQGYGHTYNFFILNEDFTCFPLHMHHIFFFLKLMIGKSITKFLETSLFSWLRLACPYILCRSKVSLSITLRLIEFWFGTLMRTTLQTCLYFLPVSTVSLDFKWMTLTPAEVNVTLFHLSHSCDMLSRLWFNPFTWYIFFNLCSFFFPIFLILLICPFFSLSKSNYFIFFFYCEGEELVFVSSHIPWIRTIYILFLLPSSHLYLLHDQSLVLETQMSLSLFLWTKWWIRSLLV